MRGWLTWADAGHVDRLGREGVVTEFFFVVIPVWPSSHSIYQLYDPDGELQRIRIPLDKRSVAIGYLRTPCWFIATILAAGGVMNRQWGFLALACAVAALAAVFTFAAGKLSATERERRLLLQRVTGVGIPPELMSREMRENACEQLASTWLEQNEVEWTSSIALGVADEVLVAIAEYDRSRVLIARAYENLYAAEGN
jgi:hypothetical protein